LTEAAADAIARLYDLDLSVEPGDVDLYRALAKRTGGPILELAVGSGRIAVPLAEDGHLVLALGWRALGPTWPPGSSSSKAT
jgi:hypothetical protein